MNHIEQRTIDVAKYLILTKTTIRKAALAFGLAKSTVHYDLSHRLPLIDDELYNSVRQILNKNFQEKNIRGGMATKEFYLKQKLNKNGCKV